MIFFFEKFINLEFFQGTENFDFFFLLRNMKIYSLLKSEEDEDEDGVKVMKIYS